MGPYTITNMAEDRSTYMLAELDGKALSGVYLEEWLKEFFPWRGIDWQGLEGYKENDGDKENAVNNEEIGENEVQEAEVGGDVAVEEE